MSGGASPWRPASIDSGKRCECRSPIAESFVEKEERLKLSVLGILMGIAAGLVFLLAPPALADKASVAIEAPENAAPGSEITIRVTVTHSANTARHYVEWVKIWVNNQELSKWEFTSSNLPEGVPFTRDVKYKVAEKVEIKAEASCNAHGSKGPAILRITVQ
jgi:desulfoferrodoxin (superoxide reductase-like protein)